MVIKRKLSENIFDTANHAFLFFMILITLYPFIHVFMVSVSDSGALSGYSGFMFYPHGFSLVAYRRVFEFPALVGSYLNTLLYVSTGTVLSVVLTALGGFVLSRKNLYWKNLFTVLVVIPMYFSGGLVPFYLLIRNLHMLNTIWAIILPGAVSAYNLIIVRTNFKQIPDEMEESAKIDGATPVVILFKVLIPLALPIIAVITLFQGVALWNSWFYPAIFLTKSELYPLQLVLRDILIQNDTSSMMRGTFGAERKSVEETIKNAIIMVSVIPILCAYPFLQKYFIKGIMIGAIKG